MQMLENAPKAVGHFSIQMLNKSGEVIDSYEDNNLVVNDARGAMSALLSGKKGSVGINTLVLGTRGHNEVDNNILIPKPVGQNGYDENRTQLFSEEQGTPFFYTIKWDTNDLKDAGESPVEFTNNEVEFVAKGQRKKDNGSELNAENGKIPVKITLQGNSVQYEFTIPEQYANGADGSSVVAFTEAGLKCGEKLFSIKCFSAKIKETSVSIKIIWKIVF